MKKGFTLVELSIALVIIGLLIGGSVQMMSMLSKRAKVTEAKQQLDTLKERIIGFTQTYSRLPTQVEFSQKFGDVEDPWGKTIDYYPGITVSFCDKSSTDLNISDKDGNPKIENVAFALVSGGANRNMQTDLAVDKILYNMGEDDIDDNGSDFNRPEEYDDHSVVVSLTELQSAVDCPSNILKIDNTILPRGTQGVPYEVNPTVFATGGQKNYVYSITDYAGTDASGANYPGGSNNTFTWNTPTKGNYHLKFKVTDQKSATDERILLLVIDDNSSMGSGGSGGSGGTSAYDQCVDNCIANHSNQTAQDNCITNTCEKLK